MLSLGKRLFFRTFFNLFRNILINQQPNTMKKPEPSPVKDWSLKNIIVILFTIEQLLIIYIIASKKGIALIDWFSNLFN